MSLKLIPAEKRIKLLVKTGFVSVRRRGSHVILCHPDGRSTVIPLHQGEDIGKGSS